MDLVSIVVPMYNAESFISETLNSILNQTYQNFDVLCVDDISTDRTVEIVKSYMDEDARIKLYQPEEKGGASMSRNLAIREAKGKYIAFLDADDVWLEEKLEKQIQYMEANNLDFTYTYFGLIDEESKVLDTYRTSPDKITYKSLLYGNTIGCLTVVYNAEVVGLIQIPRIDKRNDFALWLEVLKNTPTGVLFPEIQSLYRISDQSLSKKDGKINLIRYHIDLHKRLQGYGIIRALYYTFFNIANTFTISKKYTKRRVENV